MKKTLTLLTAITLVSCGSIIKNKKSTEIESEKETDTRTNTLITENSDTYTISPADLSQPITFGGKTYTNTIIKYEKANKVTEEVKKEKVAEKQVIEVNEKVKEVDYTNFIIALAILLFLMFLFSLLFINYQLKKLNPLR
jgi:protein tyrosine/serine phosphatase